MSRDLLKNIQGSTSNQLLGKRIALCVCGSVASIKSVELARELIRHGAEVYPIMSTSAKNIIHPNILKWATGNSPVTKLTGKIEHIQLAGNWDNKVDLIIIYPATANTIGKIASGIDDTPITSVAITAMGSNIPIFIAPAMHQPMYNNIIVKENISKLIQLKVKFLLPYIEEDKAKIIAIDEVLEHVINQFNNKKFLDKKIIITAGPTIEYIDPVRIISNKSSGKTGLELAKEAKMRGANVTLVYGYNVNVNNEKFNKISVDTTENLRLVITDLIKNSGCDIFISAGAPTDYTPNEKYENKIKTRNNNELSIKLHTTPKVVNMIKQISKDIYLVVFKAEYNLSKNKLINEAKLLMQESQADLVVINDVGKKGLGFQSNKNKVYLYDKHGHITNLPTMSKYSIATKILDYIFNNT